MNFWSALRELHLERQRLTELIDALESFSAGKSPAEKRSRRGRKQMGPDERRLVSERMKKYWAKRKAASEKAVEAENSLDAEKSLEDSAAA